MKRFAFVPLFLLGCLASAQLPPPAYDAASVKENHSGSNGMGGTIGIKRGGSVSMRNVNARLLIEIAYDLQDYQLSRGPAWTTSTGYDIDAKPETAVDEEVAKLMLQNMLAARFQLRVHHENSTVNAFHLVVDKGGSKLQPSEAPGIGFRIQSMKELQGPADMTMLARYLKAILHVPVDDQTGLTGKYDIRMKWSDEMSTADHAGLSAAEPSVSIFTALKQQLGLSLETTKVPIDVIVIDRVEKPTEN